MTITPLREIQLHWMDIFESYQTLVIRSVAAVAKNWDFVSERAFALEFRICLLSCLARETIKFVLFRNFPQKRKSWWWAVSGFGSDCQLMWEPAPASSARSRGEEEEKGFSPMGFIMLILKSSANSHWLHCHMFVMTWFLYCGLLGPFGPYRQPVSLGGVSGHKDRNGGNWVGECPSYMEMGFYRLVMYETGIHIWMGTG